MQVVVVAATGMVIGSLPHIAAGRRAGLSGMSARLVAVTCVAFAFHPLAARLIRMRWVALAVLAVLADARLADRDRDRGHHPRR